MSREDCGSSVVDNEGLDRAVAVLVCASCRVVSVVDVVASAAGGKDVVATIVDVEDDTVLGLEAVANSAVAGMLERLELDAAKTVGSSPDDKAAAGITTVVLEPAVHLARITTPAAVSTVHRDRSNGTASTANGVRASAQTVATPFGVALAPFGSIEFDGVVGLSNSHSNKKSKKKNRTHF